ncbi:unnamed protein product, partial [Rotaria magnacalcarata]
GEIEAYYGTVEESGRGALHLYMLLWLANSKHPHELRELILDDNFRQNLINYLEDIIKEDLDDFQNNTTESDTCNIEKHNRTSISICSPIPLPTDSNFEEQKRIAVRTLASENQVHRHTSTCYKNTRITTTDNPPCRLRYPKQIYDDTMIDADTGEIRMKRSHPMINNFNEWLLLACRCNIDIKFIWSGSDTKALVYYISDYITKKNLSFHDCNALIYNAVENFEKNESRINYTDALDKSRRFILRCFNTLAFQQEISAVQVASYLMGRPDHYTSHTFVKIYLIGIECYLEQSLGKLKEKQQLNCTTNEYDSIDELPFHILESSYENDGQHEDQNESFELESGVDENNLVLCNKRIDYQLRPKELDDVCLYTFYCEYRKAKMTTFDNYLLQDDPAQTPLRRRGRPASDRWKLQSTHPQYSSHLIIRRSFSVVPVLVGPSIPRREREDTIERYARAILTLFCPWRNVLDICDPYTSWSDVLQLHQSSFTTKSNRVIENIQLLHDCKRDRDSDLFQLVNQPLPSRPINSSSPYSDANVEDTEEILALLNESIDYYPSLLNDEIIENDGVRASTQREHLNLTLANVIRSERFSYINNIAGLPDFVYNKRESNSIQTNDTNDLLHVGNEHHTQKIHNVPNFAQTFNLNKEQIRIFNTITSHIQRTIIWQICTDLKSSKPEHLLMYIGGAGGCGKSRVTEAICAFMSHHDRLHTLRSLAPSSVAAVAINGLTMQSILRESRNRLCINITLTQTEITSIETKWKNINYCLIDEISMVGYHMLARLHKITTIAKHTQPSIPFGGVNMIFLGDFVQYPPVLDRPLYLNLLSPNHNVDDTLDFRKQNEKRLNVSERDIQCKVGRALWLQVNKVFFLIEQMRNKDPVFMVMQSRLRIGQCNNEDYELLCKRVVSLENDIKSLREPPWNSATILVFRNEIRTNINNYCVFHESKKYNHVPMAIVAHDRVRNHEIDSDDLRRFLLSIPDNKTEVRTVTDDDQNLQNTHNFSHPKFPTNTVYITQPLYALVELPQSKLTSCLTNLQPTIVPIVPQQKTIKIDLKSFITSAQKRLLNNKTSITISRTQLPIVPAYAMATHKCQGKTLPYGIIDLVPAPYSKSDLANVYVPISRFTSRNTTSILRHFPRSVLDQKSHPDTISELKHLENLYEQNQDIL